MASGQAFRPLSPASTPLQRGLEIIKPPLFIGWVSSRVDSPYVIINDADGHIFARSEGATQEQALERARFIVEVINREAGV